jgi:hypothetical protein
MVVRTTSTSSSSTVYHAAIFGSLGRGGQKCKLVRGLEEHVRITLIFSRIISFMSFTVLLSHMYFFRRM